MLMEAWGALAFTWLHLWHFWELSDSGSARVRDLHQSPVTIIVVRSAASSRSSLQAGDTLSGCSSLVHLSSTVKDLPALLTHSPATCSAGKTEQTLWLCSEIIFREGNGERCGMRQSSFLPSLQHVVGWRLDGGARAHESGSRRAVLPQRAPPLLWNFRFHWPQVHLKWKKNLILSFISNFLLCPRTDCLTKNIQYFVILYKFY